MPPAGWRARNCAIGEFSPKGEISSILALGERHEHGGDAVLGERHGRRHLGAERAAIDFRCRFHVGDRYGDMIEAADHGSLPSPSAEPDDMDFGDRALAVAGADEAAHGEPRGLVHAGIVAPLARRSSRERRRDRVGTARAPRSSSLGEALHADARRRHSWPSSRSSTTVASAAPLKVMRWRFLSVSPAVSRSALPSAASRPVGTSPMTRGGAGREPHHLAVPRHDRLRHAAGFGEPRLRQEMARLAMDRHGDRRPHRAVHAHELVLRRMARDMDEMVVLGDDLDAALGERVLQAPDRALVAGDDARGEDHRVARLEHDMRDARPRRCAPAPSAARPGCRCRAAAPCRAADMPLPRR